MPIQHTPIKKETPMTSITGSFSGKITKNSSLTLTDLPNHSLSIAEVSGVQASPDPLWNNANITYWGITDLREGKGTQRGYYNNIHGDKGREWGTFEGQVSTAGGGMTVEGTWKIEGGDGDFRGVTGNGTFKTVAKSETEVEATWAGTYELAKAQAS
jgi:hypothetical protein